MGSDTIECWRTAVEKVEDLLPQVDLLSEIAVQLKVVLDALVRLELGHPTRWLVMTPPVAVGLRNRWRPWFRVLRRDGRLETVSFGGMLLAVSLLRRPW